jgi:hypothetical protein
MSQQLHQPQSGLGDNLERLRLPRRGVELGALTLSEGPEQSRVVSARLSSREIETNLVSDLGTFITAFSHEGKSYVVRFAAHGKEISVLPADNEHAGIENNRNRLFVSTVPTDLGDILLTPFTGTGLPRLLTTLAVQHALATTGHATAHVSFAQIRNVLERCGLTESFKIPIHQHERLEAENVGRTQVDSGLQYNYDTAIMLKDKVVMGRSISKGERERCQHWDLSSNFRLIEYTDGMYRENSIPRRQ